MNEPVANTSEYEEPEIVYEGELEIQAGSPLSVISDFEEVEW